MAELHLPEGAPERGETWTADRVQLWLARPAWLRGAPVVSLGVLLFSGAVAALGAYWVAGSVVLLLVTFGFLGLWLALVLSVLAWLQVPIGVSIGPEGLTFGGKQFARQELVRVRREGRRYVLTVRGRSDWRSPQVAPVDPDRLLAMMQGAVPEPEQVEEDRLQELHAQRELQQLRER